MNRILLYAVFAASILFLSGKPSIAQRDLPRGDYKQTCRDERVDGDRLFARCQKRDGGWRDTSLDYRRCTSPIVNDNGNLRCDQGDRRAGWEENLPPGDYKRTCREMHMEGDRLVATCQKRNGGWRNTNLNHVEDCRSRIANDNGHLVCERY